MDSSMAAFAAGGAIAPFRLGAALPRATSGRRGPAVAHITMQETATKKEKKKAKVQFATDMKGKPVWSLRSAKPEDAASTAELFSALPPEMFEAYVDPESGGTMLCEGTIKGTKEGEGFKQRVFGAALVSIGNRKRNPEDRESDEWVKFGEFIGVKVDAEMPDAEAVKKMLALGAMKKLKVDGAADVRLSVAKDAKKDIDYFKELGFKQKSSDDDGVHMVANLATLSPEPGKKIDS